MRFLILLPSVFIVLLVSCKKKQEEHLEKYRAEYNHISRKWKVQEAYTNNTGNEMDNAIDVTYDWVSWTVEFRENDAYKIFDYSPDSLTCIVESGIWQINIDGPLILTGSENLIEFNSSNIIDQGETENNWIKRKNENNMLWIWIQDSYYPGTGVFLKMVPY